MRTGNAARHDRILRVFERHMRSAMESGLCRVRIDHADVAGDRIQIEGDDLVNFGACAYMGLNVDPRLKAGATAAVERYGPVFSSSTAYLSVPLYSELEHRMRAIMGRPVVIPTTTTLGHLGAIPALVGPGDAVVIDSQAHSSIHLATQSLIASGIPVRPVAHNDTDEMRAAFEMMQSYDKVWYLADGIYSMTGGTFPTETLRDCLAEYDNLWAYIDDAHALGWYGYQGRGLALETIGDHPRLVVAASMAKSFASGGAVISFPTEELARHTLLTGGTFTFSGPLHPAELGAAVASADIHLSDEQVERAKLVKHHIRLTSQTLDRLGIDVVDRADTPIWFTRVGGHDTAVAVARTMLDAGYFVNLASFPAVPLGQSGVRFTNSIYHSDEQLVSMLETLAEVLAEHTVNVVIDLTEDADLADLPAAGM